jgi:hypothetical protein
MLPDHHFHALSARERTESLRATMIASRRRRRRRDEESKEAGPSGSRLQAHRAGHGAATLVRRPA